MLTCCCGGFVIGMHEGIQIDTGKDGTRAVWEHSVNLQLLRHAVVVPLEVVRSLAGRCGDAKESGSECCARHNQLVVLDTRIAYHCCPFDITSVDDLTRVVHREALHAQVCGRCTVR